MFRPRRLPATFALAALTLAATARAEREPFVIDPVHSDVTFRIRHFVSKFTGRFTQMSGTLDLDRKNPSASQVDVKIPSTSLETSNEGRNKHLNSPEFFDTAKFPEITFHSTKIVDKGSSVYEVTGDLTMHGVTKPVILTVQHGGFVGDGRGGERTGFDVTGKVNRKDFGIVWNRALDSGPMLGDDVDISISIEATKKKADAPAPSKPAQ